MKTEVYSWRVSADLKTGLEREAHRRKVPVSTLLDLAARDWLNKSGSDADNHAEQLRLQSAALECFGAFAGGGRHRSENTRQIVRQRLRRRHGG